jgi:hypothetical protein
MQYDGLAAGRELKRCKSLFEELVELLVCSFNLSLPTPRFEKKMEMVGQVKVGMTATRLAQNPQHTGGQSATAILTHRHNASHSCYNRSLLGTRCRCQPADPQHLLHNFIAYLCLILPPEMYAHYIPSDLSDSANANGNGHALGN